MNWLQRTILVMAGLFLLLFALGAAESHSAGESASWLAFAMFIAALACFVSAASRRTQ